MKPRFSLVIPCFNEEGSIGELVERAAFTARAGDGEVILVNNGSTDSTGALLTRLVGADGAHGVRVVHAATNAGYGGGILLGLRSAAADVVGWTHADLQTDPADVLRALPLLESGSAVFVKGLRHARPISDRVFTTGMSVFETLLLHAPMRDINAQPTLFHRSLLDGWRDAPTDFSLDLFAYAAARRRGFAVRRFAVLFAPRRYGSSSWNVDLSAKRRFIERTLRFSLALRRRR